MIELEITIDWPTGIDPDAVARLASLLLDTGGSTLTEDPEALLPLATNTGEHDAVVGGESC